GAGGNVEEDVGNGVGRHQLLRRLFGEDQADHRTVFLGLIAAERLVRVVNLEANDRTGWNPLADSRLPDVRVVSRRVAGQELIATAAALILCLASVVPNRLFGPHAQQVPVTIEGRSLQ